MTQQIFIGNLPVEFDNNELQQYFVQFGEIIQVIIIREKNTKRSRGFGFITFVTASAAQEAIAVMDGTLIKERRVRVTLAQPYIKKSRFDLPVEAVLTIQE